MTFTNGNPYLFACGVPRSGTTLLQRMLNAHPEMAVANDTHFIPRALELTNKSLLEKADAGDEIPLTIDLIDNIKNYHRFHRMGLTADQFESAVSESVSYQQLVSRLYTMFASNSGKQLAGEKTPDYSRRLMLLNGLFPNAKLIHLIRDGRNVALSLRQWAKPNKGPGRIELWNEHPIAVCALWWRWLAIAGHEQGQRLGSAYLEVEYEALTDKPTQQLNKLCDFLGLAFSPDMLEYNRGKARSVQGLSAKNAWLPPKSGLRNWQTDMAPDEIELFEAIAADALQLFGYQVSTLRFSEKIIELANHCQNWWVENFPHKSVVSRIGQTGARVRKPLHSGSPGAR